MPTRQSRGSHEGARNKRARVSRADASFPFELFLRLASAGFTGGGAASDTSAIKNAILALKSGGIQGMWEKTSSPHCIASALGLCLAVAGSPALGAEHGFDGIYSGKRVLTKGSSGPNCPEEDNVSITIHGKTLTFNDSTFKEFIEPFYLNQTDHSARFILEREVPYVIMVV
jgi:hypothetical protein